MGGREEPLYKNRAEKAKSMMILMEKCDMTHFFTRNVIPGEAYHKRQVHFFDLAMALPK